MPTLTLSPMPKAEPAYRPRPGDRTPGLVTFLDQADTPIVYVRQQALDQIIAHSHDQGPNETIGFLAGRSFRDDRGAWTLIESVWCCRHANSSRATVATTDRDEHELDVWRQGSALALDKLGWWHSHYELRFAQYSGTDLDNQQMWCPRPWQVGLLVLVDNGVPRVRCYLGPNSESLFPLRREDGTAESLPERRLQVPSIDSPPILALIEVEPTPATPPIRWARVAAAVATGLMLSGLVGLATGYIPTWSEVWPPTHVNHPVIISEERDHVESREDQHRGRATNDRRDPAA